MSTPNVVNSSNTPTDVIFADYMAKASITILKKKRFDYGKGICMNNMLEAIILSRLICDAPCYIDEEDEQTIRERLIHISILDLDDL